MRFRVLGVLAVMALGAVAPGAGGAGEMLEADRPDLAEGPVALAPGSVQVEMGVTRRLLGRSAVGRETFDSVGELLVRAGFAPGWEARLGLPSWHAEFRLHSLYDPAVPRVLETNGFGDAALGVKRDLPLLYFCLEAGLIVEVVLPVGEAFFGGGGAGAGVTLAASLESAPGDWCGNVGYSRSGDAGELLATVSFERRLHRRVAAFAEAAWLGGDGESRRVAGAGLLWQVAPGLRLDVRGGGEFASGGSEPLFGAGVVRRW